MANCCRKKLHKTDLDQLIRAEKCALVSLHPVACARYFSHCVQKFFKHLHQSPFASFGKLHNFFYSVEFQYRGNPHIHGLPWIQNAPKLDINTDEEISSYIDQIIKCTSNVPQHEIQYLKAQRHRHAKTCIKKLQGKKICQLGPPWPPMSKTQILRPIDGEDLLHVEQYKTLYAQIQELVEKLGPNECSMTFGEFLTKLGISESLYILVIQSSLDKPKVFIKCDLLDICMNCYIKHLLSAWQGNHDIQFVLDAYSCVVYICDYMTKALKHIGLLLLEAYKEAKAGNMTLKESEAHGKQIPECSENIRTRVLL